MNGKKVKLLRKLLVKPDVKFLLLIHQVCGDKTKDMEYRQLYQTTKKLYKDGMINFKGKRAIFSVKNEEIKKETANV